MKRLFYVFILVLGVGLNCVAQDCVINVKAKGLPDGLKVTLQKHSGQVGIQIASDTVRDGRFKFIVPLEEGLTKASFFIKAPGFSSRFITLFLRPGAKVEITGNDPYVSAWEVRSDVPEQTIQNMFVNNKKDLIEAGGRIDIKYYSERALTTDGEVLDSLRNAYRNNAYKDSIDFASLERDIDFLEKTTVCNVWYDIMEDVCRYCKSRDKKGILKAKLEDLYNNLNETEKNTISGQRIESILFPSLGIIKEGDRIPVTEFYDLNGAIHTLKEFDGKWILLDFWCGGCYNCLLAVPELNELADKYSNDLAVVSLSIDNESVWKIATDGFNITGNNWNEMKEDLGLYKAFNKSGFPLFVLVSPEGVVKWSDTGYSKGKLIGIFESFVRGNRS